MNRSDDFFGKDAMSQINSERTAPSCARDSDYALRRYDTLLRYQAAQNSTYWTMSQFFLVTQVGLLGFVASSRFLFDDNLKWRHYVSLLVLAIVGATLSELWRRATKSGVYWIMKFDERINTYRDQAFDSRFEELHPKQEPHSIFGMMRGVCVLFFSIWVGVCCLGMYLLVRELTWAALF